MMTPRQEISVRGRNVRVPMVQVDDRTVIVTGRFLHVASIHDSTFLEGTVLPDPAAFVRKLTASGVRADLFTFSQKIDEHEPQYSYAFDWDNVAVAPTADFNTWWEGLPQVSRKNVRRAGKRGVTVEVAAFDDTLVRGIKAIYDETPIRQGRRFWHFGKDIEAVRSANQSYHDRCDFIAAYYNAELIGFMKLVYVDKAAIVMQILAKEAHYDKRPMNALISKAVEVCHQKGMAHLVYSKFTYGKKTDSDIAEFKRRNGFVQMDFPKYFVPLTTKGRVALALSLHRSALERLPSGMIHVLLSIRSRVLALMQRAPWNTEIVPKRSATIAEGSEPL
jgi:hypothetical protein